MNDKRLQNECKQFQLKWKRICPNLNVEDTHKHKYEIDTGNFRFPKGESSKRHFCFFKQTQSFNSLVTWCNTSCLHASSVTRVVWKCWLVMIVFYSLYKPGWFKCFCKLRIVWFMSFVLFVMWEIISQGPIKPCTFSHRPQVIFKDWLLLLWCCAYPLNLSIVEQRNRLVWGLHVWFSENFFETQGQNACIYNNCWTTKLLSAWGPDFFVYPHFQKSKNTILVSQ